MFTTLQHARNFTTDTARRYARLAADTAFVAVFATDLAAEPSTGVRGVALSHADPLTGEWSVIVIGPHFTGALLARDVGDTEADSARRFDYQVTYNRPTVLAAASLLSHHIPSSPTPGPDHPIQQIIQGLPLSPADWLGSGASPTPVLAAFAGAI